MIHIYHKEAVYDHFVADANGHLPTDITFARLKKIKPHLLASWEYDQELLRHGIGNTSIWRLRDTDAEGYAHLRGNFWSMVLDEWFKER